MRRTRLTITLKSSLLSRIDQLIDHQKIRNRSHAIEFILSEYFKPQIKEAVILAGGKGIKLRPYTYEIPKSLLPIKSKPILEYLIEGLKKSEISRIILCIGYLGEKIKEYLADGKKFGVKIIYQQEKSPLGTGGALKQVKKLISGSAFLVVYGDILTNFNFSDLITFHLQQQTLASVALTLVKDPSLFGQIKLYGTKVVNFRKKIDHQKEASLVNTGIYVFEKEIFQYFPSKKVFDLDDVLEKLSKENKIAGFVFESQWFDVGTFKNYEMAIKQFKPR